MLMNIRTARIFLGAFAIALSTAPSVLADEASKSRVVDALQNLMALDRPGQDGYATIWDGNKYVQCGRMFDRSLRCEAAGTLMQPSLEHVLTPERIRLVLHSIRLPTPLLRHAGITATHPA